MSKSIDFVDSHPESKTQSDSLASKVYRELELIVPAVVAGSGDYLVQTVVRQPEQLIPSIATGVAFSLASKGPLWLKVPTMLGAVYGGAHYLANTFESINNCLPAVQRAWDGKSQSDDRSLVAANLGPAVIDFAMMYGTGKISNRVVNRLTSTELSFMPSLQFAGTAGRFKSTVPGGMSEFPRVKNVSFMDRLEFGWKRRLNPSAGMDEVDARRFSPREGKQSVEGDSNREARMRYFTKYWQQKRREALGPRGETDAVEMAQSRDFRGRVATGGKSDTANTGVPQEPARPRLEQLRKRLREAAHERVELQSEAARTGKTAAEVFLERQEETMRAMWSKRRKK